MPHNHNIIDDDSHFVIDPAARSITSDIGRHYIVQFDHNSEQFTFEIPRHVDGHDMSVCDRIEIHYTNITQNKREQNDDVYVVRNDDYTVDKDKFYFSWLVSDNATQFAGYLKFSVTFLCHNENGEIIYEWGTTNFENVTVLAKNRNTGVTQVNHTDLYNSLKQDVLDSIPEDTPVTVNGVSPDESGDIKLSIDVGVTSVNGVQPDDNGDVNIEIVDSYSREESDKKYATKEDISTVSGGGQADWSASEGEPGYVKNRTHWVEQTTTELFAETMVLEDGDDRAVIESYTGMQDFEAKLADALKYSEPDEYGCVPGFTVVVDGVEHAGMFVGPTGPTAIGVATYDEKYLMTFSTVSPEVKLMFRNSDLLVPKSYDVKLYYTGKTYHTISYKYLPFSTLDISSWQVDYNSVNEMLNDSSQLIRLIDNGNYVTGLIRPSYNGETGDIVFSEVNGARLTLVRYVIKSSGEVVWEENNLATT